MKFLLAVIDSQSESATGDEMSAIDAFNDGLRQNGHFVLAVGITHPDQSTVIDNRNGRGQERPGPLNDNDLFMAGLWIIEADSHATALELAREGSRACNRVVEVRPLH